MYAGNGKKVEEFFAMLVKGISELTDGSCRTDIILDTMILIRDSSSLDTLEYLEKLISIIRKMDEPEYALELATREFVECGFTDRAIEIFCS